MYIYNTSIGILDIVFTIHYIPTNSLYNIATRPPKKLQHWQMGPFVAVILRQHGAVYTTYNLDILFPSNHNIHKSWCGLCF